VSLVFLKNHPGVRTYEEIFPAKENSGLLQKKKCEMGSKFNYQVKSIY